MGLQVLDLFSYVDGAPLFQRHRPEVGDCKNDSKDMYGVLNPVSAPSPRGRGLQDVLGSIAQWCIVRFSAIAPR